MKKTKVPVRYGWFSPSEERDCFGHPTTYNEEWFDNIDNHTSEQIDQFADFQSPETKEVLQKEVYDNEKFIKEFYSNYEKIH
jgi:hypothetical protein